MPQALHRGNTHRPQRPPAADRARWWTRTLTIAAVSLTASPVLANNHPIEGYANVLSARPGDAITFYVHMPAPKTQYSVVIQRYGQDMIDVNKNNNPVPQTMAGPFTCNNGINQNYDSNSYVNGASWANSFQITVPTGTTFTAPCTGQSVTTPVWKSGIYSVKLTDLAPTADYFHVVFIVRDSDANRKSIALIASTNTWQAYNFWPSELNASTSFYPSCGKPQSRLLSFLRPNPYARPENVDVDNDCPGSPYSINTLQWMRTEHLAAGEIRIARWLERNSRPYSMLTDWDVDQIPDVLDPTVFSTVIISTHNEYWSQNMYEAVQKYLNKGGNVINLSGNTMYRKVTLTAAKKIQLDRDWNPDERSLALSIEEATTGANTCTRFDTQRPDPNRWHWILANPASPSTPPPTSFGASGEIPWPSPTFCAAQQRGAAGWEQDRLPFSMLVNREVSLLASGTDGKHADMFYIRRASAGQIFTAGSITFGQSLISESRSSPVGHLSIILSNLLGSGTTPGRFSARYFGDFDSLSAGNTKFGQPDVIVRNPSDGNLGMFRGNDGQGFIGDRVQVDSQWGGFNLIISPGDFDSDGHPDLLARKSDGSLWLYPGTGAGTLIQGAGHQIDSGWNMFDALVTPGDFNGDGAPDVIARRPDGAVFLYKGNGQGGFVQDGGTNIANQWQVFSEIFSPGDFDSATPPIPVPNASSGIPDVIARKPDGTLWLFRGNGLGAFADHGTQFNSGWQIYDKLMAAGDMDRDGRPDILARRPDGVVFRYRGTGTGNLVQGSALQVATGWQVYDQIMGIW